MFYLVEVNTEVGGTHSKGITEFDTMDAALIAFHQSVAYAMSNENVLQMGRTILNDAMMPMRTENWTRTVEPDSEPTPKEN